MDRQSCLPTVSRVSAGSKPAKVAERFGKIGIVTFG